MNEDEFRRLKARFGENTATWPSPYRQEASSCSSSLDQNIATDDGALDRLVLEAALAPVDERALTGKILAHIGQSPQPILPFPVTLPLRLWPALAVSAGLVLMIAAAGGYTAASNSNVLSDDVLLALATGEPPSGLVEDMSASDVNGG